MFLFVLSKFIPDFCETILQMMLNSKDLSFVGYTYKNFDAVKGLKHSGLSLQMTSLNA
jgi:hypothetical protein